MRPKAAAALSLLLLASCSNGSHTGRASATTAPGSSASAGTTARTSDSPDSPTTSAGTSSGPATGTGVWTTYQGSPARLGVAPDQPALTPLTPAWNAPLDEAAVYGQPLFYDGRLIVATEADDVFALNPRDGATLWQVNVGVPLHNVAGYAGCGNVDPLGITSTPVIDPNTGIVYVVAELSSATAPPIHHQLLGIDVATGKIVSRQDADPPLPPGENPIHLLQRAALALGSGMVYIGYGGQYGDCGAYHGWVVGLTTSGSGGMAAFDVTPQSSGGAVWQGGSGPSVDTAGNVYVTTGNPNSSGPAPWAEAALKLSPTLQSPPEAVFKDVAATGDLDLSTGSAVLLPDGNLFVAGKTDHGFRLPESGLGPATVVAGKVCGSDPDGGSAFDSALDAVYIPCQDGGIQQVDLATNRVGWHSGQVNSTVVLVDGELWSVGYSGGVVEELDPATGQVLAREQVGRAVPHFASLAAVDGLLVVPTLAGVRAFSGPRADQ